MASQIELDIQRHASRYLDGSIQLYELEDFLLPALWDLAESEDEAARELAGSINNLIAETSRGDRTLESLREGLEAVCPSVLGPVEIVFGKPPQVQARSANQYSFWKLAASA
ncbi:MAG TPA: hypothetical protein VLY24_06485 [Bryobacteraceae bacterium]|nr:hypothetical protein [Bryobacteraceae bacterium]